MNDDWSTPTNEHLRNDFADEHTPVPDPLPRSEDGDRRLLDAFLHEIALDASNDLTRNASAEQSEDDRLLEWATRLMSGGG